MRWPLTISWYLFEKTQWLTWVISGIAAYGEQKKQTNKQEHKQNKKRNVSVQTFADWYPKGQTLHLSWTSTIEKKNNRKINQAPIKSWTSVILRIKHPPLDKCYQNHWFIHWTLLPTTTGAWISPCWRDASRSQYTKRSLHEFLLNTLSDTDD